METAKYMVDHYLGYDPESWFALGVQKCYLSNLPVIEQIEK
jgi:hypothetical protein